MRVAELEQTGQGGYGVSSAGAMGVKRQSGCYSPAVLVSGYSDKWRGGKSVARARVASASRFFFFFFRDEPRFSESPSAR